MNRPITNLMKVKVIRSYQVLREVWLKNQKLKLKKKIINLFWEFKKTSKTIWMIQSLKKGSRVFLSLKKYWKGILKVLKILHLSLSQRTCFAVWGWTGKLSFGIWGKESSLYWNWKMCTSLISIPSIGALKMKILLLLDPMIP